LDADGGILEDDMIPLVLVRWQSAVDFVVLTAALYVLLRWAQQARALRVALVVGGLHAGALVAAHFDLVITSWVLDGAAILAIVLLVLVFQAELRHFFMRLDGVLSWRWHGAARLTETYQSLSRAAFRLAGASVGALVVLERRNSVGELTSDGLALDAEVSSQILEAIFQKTSPVHDGAVVVRGDRIVKVGGVLPLTERDRVPSYYGTRHRAAMGLAERCDALLIVVSEERGEVTLMEGRRIVSVDDEEKLALMLEKLCSRPADDLGSRLRHALFVNAGVKFAALGLAALIWSATFLATGATVRTVNVPVEFVGVPGGLEIAYQSPDHLEVQVRGGSWLMDSVSLTRLVARFNLGGRPAGSLSIPVSARDVQLPPGIIMDRVAPTRITVRLAPRLR
jgi:diadenylate cyclase